MARVKGAMMTRKRRNKVLKLAKGYWGAKSKHFKMANEQVMKSLQYAYTGRRLKTVSYTHLPFVIGQPTVLREGKDVTVFATGYMVSLALQAAEQVEDKADVKVVNVSTLKPLNNEAIRQLAAGSRGVVTAEEHSVIGGLGGAVAQALAPAPIPMSFVGIEDCFGCSAHSYGELLEHFGLTARHIAEEILKFVD